MRDLDVPVQAWRSPLAWIWLLVLGGLVAIGYAAVAHSWFLADDFHILAVLRDTPDAAAASQPEGYPFFRPFGALTYWWTWLLAGPDPFAFRLFSLVCHALNAWFVSLLVRQWGGGQLPAAFAGAAFALFPLHPECVTWIADRFGVLSVTGALWSLNGWVAYLRGGGGRWALLHTFLGLACAMLTKDTMMVLPLVWIAFAWASTERPWRRHWDVLLALVGLLLAYLAVRLAVLGGFGGHAAGDANPHLQIHPIRALGFGWDTLTHLVRPDRVSSWSWVAPVWLVIGLAAHGALRRFCRLAWPLWLVFALSLLPVANLVILGDDGKNSRFLYLPSALFCASLGLLIASRARLRAGRKGRVGVAVFCVLLLCAYLSGLRRENRTWAEAAEICASIVRDLDKRMGEKPYEWLLIHVPDDHHGSYVFKNGIEKAVELFVAPGLRCRRIADGEWEELAARRRAEPGTYTEILLVRYEPARGVLVDP